jgi:hypothetical protein
MGFSICGSGPLLNQKCREETTAAAPKYRYDRRGLISRVHSAAGWTDATYDARGVFGPPFTKHLPNDTVTHHTYDAAGRVASIPHRRSGGSAICSFAFTGDANGNILPSEREDGWSPLARYASRVSFLLTSRPATSSIGGGWQSAGAVVPWPLLPSDRRRRAKMKNVDLTPVRPRFPPVPPRFPTNSGRQRMGKRGGWKGGRKEGWKKGKPRAASHEGKWQAGSVGRRRTGRTGPTSRVALRAAAPLVTHHALRITHPRCFLCVRSSLSRTSGVSPVDNAAGIR